MFSVGVRIVYIYFVVGRMHCVMIGRPQFESEWLPIEAQSISSEQLVQHNIGDVPGLVEVLVKAVDGPNKDFIFKAIGNGERDDDRNEMYGGVLYIYNDVYVRIMAPKIRNHVDLGAAIYTGESPEWLGINYQTSYKAEVKVRCWEKSALPTPCFNINGHVMTAGSPNINDTYAEFSHGLKSYPMLVKVRGQMLDGLDIGWYTDAQGSSSANLVEMSKTRRTGGLKYAYNNETIRIWTSSWPSPDGVMFARNDGWGNDDDKVDISSQGLIDVFAWCDISLAFEETLIFGPSYSSEEFQLSLPDSFSDTRIILTSVMVEALDGPNNGYLFEGIGSAVTNLLSAGTPCGYGGLVYAYTSTAIRIWRPDTDKGAAICISDSMGFGTNSQASQNGKLIFRAFQLCDEKSSSTYFRMIGHNLAYNGTHISTQQVASILACAGMCRQHRTCMTYVYNNNTCSIYETANKSLLFEQYGSTVWGMI